MDIRVRTCCPLHIRIEDNFKKIFLKLQVSMGVVYEDVMGLMYSGLMGGASECGGVECSRLDVCSWYVLV